MSPRSHVWTAGLAAGLLGMALLPTAAAAAPAAKGKSMKSVAKSASGAPAGGIELVKLPSATSPLVSIRLLFRIGSMHDPAGKEGLAGLTQAMLSQGGTAKRSYSALLNELYPTASSINAFTDREVTLFGGTVHREKLAEYTRLLEEVLLTPGFSAEDFERNRDQASSFLTNSLRGGSDELLGLEFLQEKIFAHHPYGHSPAGTVAGLKNITLDDVRAFYRQNYTRGSLMLGVAGGYPAGYPEKLARELAAGLPAGGLRMTKLPAPPEVQGRQITLVDKKTGSVGINLGFPLPLDRTNPDYYPLQLANSFFGEHRTSFGRLMVQLRGKRGLNYGNYSYIEYWQNPPGTNSPPPNTPRREQYFSVWLRPVVAADAQFALRAALYEVALLRDKGLTPQEFEDARNFLRNYSKLWAQSLSARLGYLMDSRYYGTPYYIDEIDKHLQTMTVADVNRAIRKYLQADNLQIVMIADDAEALKKTLLADGPSVKTYPAQVEPAIAEADKTIQVFPVKPAAVTVVPVAELFEK